VNAVVARLANALQTFAPQQDVDVAQSTASAARNVSIANAAPPWCWRVVGTIEAIGVDPRTDPPTVEARIADQSGWLVARWLGRAAITRLRIRDTIVLEGFVEGTPEGAQFMFDPEYQVLSCAPPRK
jgi:hypothetical protein